MVEVDLIKELVEGRIVSIKQDEANQKEKLNALVEMKQKSVSNFETLSNKISTLTSLYADVIQKSGDRVMFYQSKDAKNSDDKARSFIDILFFPIGHDVEKYGYNTPLIEFELIPEQGKLNISQRVSRTPAPLSPVTELDVNSDNCYELSAQHLSNFLKGVLKK